MRFMRRAPGCYEEVDRKRTASSIRNPEGIPEAHLPDR